ncbi:gluconokinase [Streptomyces collinus]|uniref:Gluconokinase n=2 Tax=Streptomyces collinus TaxID=42684 RepID=S5UV47_STRC3|nr:gluconokinase [Streptomyces collinus Tu 365]UJA09709.1 gluconokinase [Streptomyces collinus]UJA15427.1 gluconokinase [Streptomyces collinus]
MADMAGGSRVVVVMGVSASGKSTVGARLAHRLGVPFLEGDDLHSAANRAKMASGHPLDDADRRAWLAALTQWIRAAAANGSGGVVSCSSLRRAYRDRFRATGADVWFLYLALDPVLAAERIARRTGHFMPPELLGSQYATLDPLQADEPGVTIDASGGPERVMAQALRAVCGPDR